MRRTVVGVLLIIVLSVIWLGGCAAETDTEAPEAYRIGAVLSLSGPQAGLGEPEHRAIELEVERINDAGGVHVRPIEVLCEDDAIDEAKAVTAAGEAR